MLEAKDINPSLDFLNTFHSIDAYVQVSVVSEMGSTLLSTRPERGGRDPKWHQLLSFSEVPLGSSIIFSLFDRKKLTADVLLGQVRGSRTPN